jgi:TonB family protein
MLLSLDEMNYKSTGVCVAITHIAILLLIVLLAINLPKTVEPVMMMAQMIDRESVAMTTAVHVSPSKRKKIEKDQYVQEIELSNELVTENKLEGALASAPLFLPNSEASELNNPKPLYPAISRQLREQGLVLLKLCISASGALESLEINQGSGYSRLDQMALKTVKQWKFIPAKKGSTPIPMCYQLPVKFILE